MPQNALVPDAGDIVWIDFDPRVGHEQSGHRPAVVLNPAAYNWREELALIRAKLRVLIGI